MTYAVDVFFLLNNPTGNKNQKNRKTLGVVLSALALCHYYTPMCRRQEMTTKEVDLITLITLITITLITLIPLMTLITLITLITLVDPYGHRPYGQTTI